MSTDPDVPVTELLHSWRGGDENSRDALFSALYDELRRLAEIQMRGERAGHTLQPTALVHECYGRLVGVELEWRDRAHFLNFAVRAMRRLLIDHARARLAQKRGDGAVQVTLDEAMEGSASLEQLFELEDAFDRLARVSERAAQAVQLQVYAGLSHREIGEVLSVSDATVDRELRFAKAWLKDRLEG